ncbi:MAG: integrase, partial [Chthoniobacterales bacterium]
NELCEQWKYSRKHAIKLLNGKVGCAKKNSRKKGRPFFYGEKIKIILLRVWKASEQPCGKRLAAMMALWLPHYEKSYGKLSDKIREQVKKISPAQIDRLLAPHKVIKGRCGTKPGGILKTQIPIRTDNWEITQPGFFEADTVAHCGTSLAGDFIWSLTFTDICSGWTSNRAVWNKGAHGIVEAIKCIESDLPFKILGFDSDNGSEFLNHHLINYFSNRPKKVGFTRSRPYRKNDNAYVEQKNWTHVRQLLGYDRLEDPKMIELINEIYCEFWEPLNNFFKPCMKLIKKERDGAKIKRYHDKPLTPCDRLLQSKDIEDEIKKDLLKKRASLNPFDLSQKLEKKLCELFTLQKAFLKNKAHL